MVLATLALLANSCLGPGITLSYSSKQFIPSQTITPNIPSANSVSTVQNAITTEINKTTFAYTQPTRIPSPPPIDFSYSADEELHIQKSLERRHLTSSLNYLAKYQRYILAKTPEDNFGPTAKIDYLNWVSLCENPATIDNIIGQRYCLIDNIISKDGRRIFLVCIFPNADLRDEAWETLEDLKIPMPILEDFYNEPYPSDTLEIFYGFCGQSLGGGWHNLFN